MSGGVKLKMSVELEALRRNATALAVMTKQTAADTVRDISVMVLQSGANVIPQSKRNRDVISAVRRYRHGVEELVKGAKKEAPGDKALWLIPRPSRRPPIGKSGGRKFWAFESASAARQHKRITYQGIGKAGFWAQLPALGVSVPGKYARYASLAQVQGICSTQIRLEDPMPTITVTNSAVSIQRLADSKRAFILSKVNNKIAGMALARKKKNLEAFKAGGGVVWRRTGVMNGEEYGKYIPAEDL